MIRFPPGAFTANVHITGKAFGRDYEIRGPLDEDKDGDPEILVVYDGVTVGNVELPLAVFTATIVTFVMQAISAAMSFVFKKASK